MLNIFRTSGNQQQEVGANSDDDKSSDEVGEDVCDAAHAQDVAPKRPAPLKNTACSKMTAFQAKLLEQLDSQKLVEEDADRAFLLSLLPDYKNLSPDQKIDFRILTLNFFKEQRHQNAAQPQASLQNTTCQPNQFGYQFLQFPQPTQYEPPTNFIPFPSHSPSTSQQVTTPRRSSPHDGSY